MNFVFLSAKGKTLDACTKTKFLLIYLDEVIRLSVKKSYRELLRRMSTYILSTAAGTGVSVILLLSFAALMYAFTLPLYFSGYLALVALGAGCIVSGIVAGRIKKRCGLKVGFRCGVIMLVLCALGALIFGRFDGSYALVKTITVVITGCCGGVIGVNRRR